MQEGRQAEDGTGMFLEVLKVANPRTLQQKEILNECKQQCNQQKRARLRALPVLSR